MTCSVARKRKLDVRPQTFKGALAHIKMGGCLPYHGDMLLTSQRYAAFCRLISVANGIAAGSCKNYCALLLGSVPFNAAVALLKYEMRLMALTIAYIKFIRKLLAENHVSSQLLVCLSLVFS